MFRIGQSAIVFALVATTVQWAVAQDAEILLDVDPGTEIQVEELDDFLANRLSVRLKDVGELSSVQLWLQVISQDEGVSISNHTRHCISTIKVFRGTN